MIKIVSLFLVFMVALAMFGKLRLRGGPPRIGKAMRCPRCGRFRIGRGPCDCRDGPG